MSLLSTYEAMKAQAVEAQQAETVKTAEQEIVDEQVAILAKYAELADSCLAEEYGDNYTKENVEKLAQLFIDHDIAVEEQMQKVAELHEAGIIMAQAFKEELNRG